MDVMSNARPFAFDGMAAFLLLTLPVTTALGTNTSAKSSQADGHANQPQPEPQRFPEKRWDKNSYAGWLTPRSVPVASADSEFVLPRRQALILNQSLSG